MYILKYYFQNFKNIPYTIFNLILQANEDKVLKDTKDICKTETIGDNYKLISEYDRVKHKYNYIKVFEKI